ACTGLPGGPGADRRRGLGGNDTLAARDGGTDTQLDCDGASPAGTADQAIVDTSDPPPVNCETVTRKRTPRRPRPPSQAAPALEAGAPHPPRPPRRRTNPAPP